MASREQSAKDGAPGEPVPQPFVVPDDLFPAEGPGPVTPWTCVRTRPRWEKRFARFLQGRGVPHYLPTLVRVTYSGRKWRESDVPVVPGYVFVPLDCTRRDLLLDEAVVRLLKPRDTCEITRLHVDIWNLWFGVRSGAEPAAGGLSPGDRVEITAGPLRGVQGQFVEKGGDRRLLLSVEMLGTVAALKVPANTPLRRVDR